MSNEQPNERSWQKKPVDPIEDILSIPPEELLKSTAVDDPVAPIRGDQKKLEDIYTRSDYREPPSSVDLDSIPAVG